jgi:NAD(P)-dependent dehydrogenase (short-subunit alcohol dehydrogenase family)
MSQLTGKVAIVTGASGIGAGIAKGLAAAGAGGKIIKAQRHRATLMGVFSEPITGQGQRPFGRTEFSSILRLRSERC